MARKSSVSRLAPEAREFLERLLAEDRLSLDELMVVLRERFPEAEASRSSVYRYQLGLREMTGKLREFDAMSRVMVAELGENPDEKAGALLCQAVTTLATHAAMSANARDDVTVEEVRKLARAAKDTLSARTLSVKERLAIEEAAVARRLREQNERLSKVAKQRGMSAETAEEIRRDILGIA